MKITNKQNLPQALVDACTTTPHNADGEFSATTLKNGAREILLTKRHWEELEDDVSNRVWALFGTAVHSLLEKENENTFVEERLEFNNGLYKITGRIDCYDMATKTIYDYKTASVWKWIYQDFDDWKFQGLVYAWLCRVNNIEVKQCRFIAMLKDHSKSKAKYDSNYPQSPVMVYEYKITEEDLVEIEKKIANKINVLMSNQFIKDDDLPVCTEEERWATKTTYAVMKEGRKTAVKLFDNEEDANSFIEEQEKDKNKMSIEVRPGENKKCNDYCPCREFCSFYKKLTE